MDECVTLQNQGSAIGDERGIASGVYYFRLNSLSNEVVTGTLHISWEER